MSRRLLIALIISASIVLGIVIASYFLDESEQTIYALVSVLFLLYTGVYLFWGLAKLILFFIYGVFTAITLVIAPEHYSLVVILIGSLIFVLNPLADFENYLNNTLDDEEIEPIHITLKGKFESFYAYRAEMKSHYHLPQMRKLFTKKWYQRVRTLSTLGLFGLDVFLVLFVANDIAIFRSITPNNVLLLYYITMIFLMMVLLHKKGFTTMMRVVKLSLFIPIIYFLVTLNGLDDLYKWIFISAVSAIGLFMVVYEWILYYTRVTYSAYQYYDKDQQEMVFANALFEPLVYNENTTEIGHYGMEVSLETFQSHLNEILIYANFHRFIITAYTHNKQYAYIFAEFHPSQQNRKLKFQSYLETIFKTHVGLREFSDLHRKFYENKFFHNTEYIVARALNLAHLLNELEIRGEVIISMVYYFSDEANLNEYLKAYPSKRLKELDQKDVFAIQTNVKARNLDYIIETTVRDILLEAMRYQGHFVRIMLYY